MNPVSGARKFCKTARCPSSETLLQYRRHYLTITELLMIDRHLRDCDFCNAEVELLKRYRVDNDENEASEMPFRLRKLAENFLAQTRQFSRNQNLMAGSPLSH